MRPPAILASISAEPGLWTHGHWRPREISAIQVRRRSAAKGVAYQTAFWLVTFCGAGNHAGLLVKIEGTSEVKTEASTVLGRFIDAEPGVDI